MLITKEDLAKMIRRRLKAQSEDAHMPKLACEGCKKEITLADDPGGLDMSQTKRGSVLVWHAGCYRRAWETKI